MNDTYPPQTPGRTINPRSSMRASALPTSSRRTSRGPLDSPAAAAQRRSSIGRPNTAASTAQAQTGTATTIRSQLHHTQQYHHLHHQQQHQYPSSTAPAACYQHADRPNETLGPRTPARASIQHAGNIRQAPATPQNITPVRIQRSIPSTSLGAAQNPAGGARTPSATNTSTLGTPRRTAMTPARRVSAGVTTPTRGTPIGTQAAQGPAPTSHAAPTPDRGSAALSRAAPGHPAGSSTSRPGLVASPYQRRTSSGNGNQNTANNVARRLNFNPAVASAENNNPAAAQNPTSNNQTVDPKTRRNVSTMGTQGSPYIRRHAPRGSRIAIDRVERTPLGSFSSISNVPQEVSNAPLSNITSPRASTVPTPQLPAQQQSVRRLTALESFRNSRRASDPKNLICTTQDLPSQDPLVSTPPDSEPVPEPAGDTLLSRMGALRGYTHQAEDTAPMPDRQEEPFGFRSTPARAMPDSSRSSSLPSSPGASKVRKLSDRFNEGTINTERVELMSLSLNRRRSRGRSGGPSDFPEETPTLTAPLYHHS